MSRRIESNIYVCGTHPADVSTYRVKYTVKVEQVVESIGQTCFEAYRNAASKIPHGVAFGDCEFEVVGPVAKTVEKKKRARVKKR